MIKNGVGFAITKTGYLHVGSIKLPLPNDENDRIDRLRAIALICANAIGDSLHDAGGNAIDSSFWEDSK